MKRPLTPHDELIEIDDGMRRQLAAEQARTGLTPGALLKDRTDRPTGLTSGQVNRWMTGEATKAQAAHFAYVLDKWREAANAPPKRRSPRTGRPYGGDGEDWIEITDDHVARLRAALAESGEQVEHFLKGRTDVPDGLTFRIVRGWLYRKAWTMRASHWRYVMERLRGAPEL